VLFFDELEALAAKRQFSRESTTTKIVSHFLSLMDGFSQNNQGVLLLGATNVPWAIDPAFRRPGRFDRVMFVPPPDRAGREAVLKLALADRPVAKGIDVASLAAKTSGFSGADLAGLVDEAADLAIEASLERGEEVELSREHLVAALKDARATTTEWLSTARNYARYANDGGQYDEVLAFLDRHAKK
jgi:SpoVK/Ycf46/Vps4 family AAA+-type ATPase